MGIIVKYFDVNLADAADDDDDSYIYIVLNAEDNDNKTSFSPGDRVYLDVFRFPYDADIEIETTIGNLQCIGTDIPEQLSAQLIFDYDNNNNLTYAPYNDEYTYAWEAEIPEDQPVAVSCAGRKITTNRTLLNILNVEYTAFKNQYVLSGVNEETIALLYASISEDINTNKTIQFGITDPPDPPREPDPPEDPPDNPPDPDDPDTPDGTIVTVGAIVHYCDTDEPAPGVQFYVNGVFRGTSGADGRIPNGIGEVVKGDTVSTRFTGGSPAIIASESDSIANEEITI